MFGNHRDPAARFLPEPPPKSTNVGGEHDDDRADRRHPGQPRDELRSVRLRPRCGQSDEGGSDWDGTPQIAGAYLVYHALGDRTGGQVSVAEVTFPSGQRPWFHTHHREDEGFYVVEGQLTVTIIEQGQRHVFVVNAGELVWAPRGYAHSYHVTSDIPARTIIVTTPGNTLPEYFPLNQNLELDPNDEQAVAAFVEESYRLYGLEFHPEIPLDA